MSNAERGRIARTDLVDTKPLLAAMEALLTRIGREMSALCDNRAWSHLSPAESLTA